MGTAGAMASAVWVYEPWPGGVVVVSTRLPKGSRVSARYQLIAKNTNLAAKTTNSSPK